MVFEEGEDFVAFVAARAEVDECDDSHFWLREFEGVVKDWVWLICYMVSSVVISEMM